MQVRMNTETLRNDIRAVLNGKRQPVRGIYESFRQCFEKTLYQEVMKHTKGNQSEAARVLGINRGRFREQLKGFGML